MLVLILVIIPLLPFFLTCIPLYTYICICQAFSLDLREPEVARIEAVTFPLYVCDM